MARGTRKTEAPDPVVIEMRRSLAQRIAARTRKEGEHKTGGLLRVRERKGNTRLLYQD